MPLSENSSAGGRRRRLPPPDVLVWLRAFASRDDRDVMELVHLDLCDAFDERRASGDRGAAYRWLWQRTRLELGFFVPRVARWQAERVRAGVQRVWRAGRRGAQRVVKPAFGLVVCGVVLVSGKWFLFDRGFGREMWEVRRSLRERVAELATAESSLRQAADSESVETRELISRLTSLQSYLRDAQTTHGESLHLHGWIGLADELLADFWTVHGNDVKSEIHWAAAINSYLDGARSGDPVALFHLGAWLADHGELANALTYLGPALDRWQTAISGGSDPAHILATYHGVLVTAWQNSCDLQSAIDAYQLERLIQPGCDLASSPFAAFVDYNAAILRVLMWERSVLPEAAALQAIALLGRSLDRAGLRTTDVASAILRDPILSPLRAIPGFDGLRGRSLSALKAEETDSR